MQAQKYFLFLLPMILCKLSSAQTDSTLYEIFHPLHLRLLCMPLKQKKILLLMED